MERRNLVCDGSDDVLDHMSIEIFEHYKSLQEIFKKNKCITGWRCKDAESMHGICNFKGMQYRDIKSEKYLETGEHLLMVQ